MALSFALLEAANSLAVGINLPRRSSAGRNDKTNIFAIIVTSLIAVSYSTGCATINNSTESASAMKESGDTKLLTDPVGAIRDYSKAITIRANYADAYKGRGDALGLIGCKGLDGAPLPPGVKASAQDYIGLAIHDYTIAIATTPDYTEAYRARASTFLLRGGDRLKKWDRAGR